MEMQLLRNVNYPENLNLQDRLVGLGQDQPVVRSVMEQAYMIE